jgi:carbon-monoxide dehydrogenase medium subunit
MESALLGHFGPDSIATTKVNPDRLNNDVHATPEFRAHLVTVLARRAVQAAIGS